MAPFSGFVEAKRDSEQAARMGARSKLADSVSLIFQDGLFGANLFQLCNQQHHRQEPEHRWFPRARGRQNVAAQKPDGHTRGDVGWSSGLREHEGGAMSWGELSLTYQESGVRGHGDWPGGSEQG